MRSCTLEFSADDQSTSNSVPWSEHTMIAGGSRDSAMIAATVSSTRFERYATWPA